MSKQSKVPKAPKWADSILNQYFKELIGNSAVSKLQSEFVDWTDVRVGTLREMVDLGVPRKTAATVKTVLNAIYREHQNIEHATAESLDALDIEEEDVVHEYNRAE